MNYPAQQPRIPASTSDSESASESARPVDGPRGAQETRAALARATGVLMALVPCTTAKARRILTDAAQSAGAAAHQMAEAVFALRTGDPVYPAVDEALRRAIAHAQTPPAPVAGSWLPPKPEALRRHVNHLRSARRRALAAPDDVGVRSELEDAAYTLCVLMGQRSTHGALLAAEELIAVNRLDAPPSGG
ncbi:DUF5133 domain-containing protein [Streptomyces sp. NPDC002138]|uniref:DUF5133 domain-containing protein n=1 Tax=Streptomyces sp. NPDC002138 TaxID=3154410 RepID=UPI003321C8B0